LEGNILNEIEKIKHRITELFDKGDAAALDRLSLVLNEVLADLALKRALLGQPESEPEPEERLEMVEKDRLDKEGDESIILWKPKP
jgi:hypothetical protein